MFYNLHESGIKIFPDSLDEEFLNEKFLEEHELKESDVFLVGGVPYRVEDIFGIGKYDAIKIKAWGLSDWYLQGGRHPEVIWHNTYARYSKDNANLVPYKGKTYFCHIVTGEILDVADKEVGEHLEFSSSGGWKSWSEGFNND